MSLILTYIGSRSHVSAADVTRVLQIKIKDSKLTTLDLNWHVKARTNRQNSALTLKSMGSPIILLSILRLFCK